MPHGMCYLWKPSLVWSMVFSEVLIALAYFSIPLSIVYFLSKRKDVRHLGIFYLFVYFIASCGLTHVMDVWIIWHPNYWLQDVLLMSTAMISVWTALAIWRVLPDALRIPSEKDLNASIASLKQTVDTLNATRRELVEREKQSALGALVAGLAHELNCHEGRPTPPSMKTVSLCCAVGASAVRLKGRSPVAEGRIIFRWRRPRFLT